MNLIAEFESFEASRTRGNPGSGESRTTAFMQHLSEDGILQDFTDADWFKLAERLGMTDDQYAAMFEGTASWILPEPEEVEDQPSAEWPDEAPHQTASSAPVTRGNPSKQAAQKTVKRGTDEFERLIDRMEDEYVTARFPNLASYAYDADLVPIDEAKEIMDEILGDIVEVRWPEGDHPDFRLKGESKWRSIQDSEDFPQPSTEEVDSDDASDEDVEDSLCYEDCSCPEDCTCEMCSCGDGKVCCCECSEETEED